MSRPDWCPEETREKAQQLAEHVIDKHEACGCNVCMDVMLEHFARALIDAHQHGRREGMEEAAFMAEAWQRPSTVKLAAGEMSAQELRTAIAVAGGISSAIRQKAEEIGK